MLDESCPRTVLQLRDSYLGDDFVGAKTCLLDAGAKRVEWNHAFAFLAMNVELCAEYEERGERVRGGRRVAQVADEGGTIAELIRRDA